MQLPREPTYLRIENQIFPENEAAKMNLQPSQQFVDTFKKD